MVVLPLHGHPTMITRGMTCVVSGLTATSSLTTCLGGILLTSFRLNSSSISSCDSRIKDNKKMPKPILRFKKLSENAFAPVKASSQAAGFDLIRLVYSCPLNRPFLHVIPVPTTTLSRQRARSWSRQTSKSPSQTAATVEWLLDQDWLSRTSLM